MPITHIPKYIPAKIEPKWQPAALRHVPLACAGSDPLQAGSAHYPAGDRLGKPVMG